MFLAQANIAFFRWPIDDPRMAGFAEQIQPINQLAEQSNGFVWRFTENYSPRDIGLPWDSSLLFFNMSVWHDLESLLAFLRSAQHLAVVDNREQWIQPVDSTSLVLWWINETTIPTVEDAIRALSLIEDNGDTQAAFSLKSSFASHEPGQQDHH